MVKATPKVLHEMSMRVNLKANKRYAIIPSAFKAKATGEFHLSIYTDRPQHEFDVTRIDDPTCRYSFIMQEYEKNERRVPSWKIKWCQENLKHMITKDDKEVSLSMSVSGIKRTKTSKMSMSKKRGARTRKNQKLSELSRSLTKKLDEDEPEDVIEEDDDEDVDLS